MKTIHLPCKNKPLHLSECSDCDELAYRVGQLEECCDLVKSKLKKLDTIQEGAEVNVQSNWDNNNPNSDAYILNKPVIPDIDEFEALVAGKQDKLVGVTALLSAAGWNATTVQTISVQGVTTSNIVWVSPIPSHIGAYSSAGIYCASQGAGQLTFMCNETPATDIYVNIVIAP